jgi:hypothetical protein
MDVEQDGILFHIHFAQALSVIRPSFQNLHKPIAQYVALVVAGQPG